MPKKTTKTLDQPKESTSERTFKPKGIVNFPMVFHLHQPINQFEHVFEIAYEKSYDPLLSALERHPKTKAAFHITGPLLEWFESKKPDYIDRVNKLVKRRQLELITGGYYEPILAMLPHEDKILQITKLTDKINELFGMKPSGMWLAERAWEPHLPLALEEAGVKYIFIDDNHIKTAGIEPPLLHHVFVTEEQGAKVAVFPINEPIRYLIPWKPINKTFEYIAEETTPDDDSIVITSIDDAEKLGLWPAGNRTTYDICYKEGYNGTPYIDEWFSLIENLDWVISLTPTEYLKKFKPTGIVYLPSTSYDKMGIWVLPATLRKKAEALLHSAKKGPVKDIDGTNHSESIKKFTKGGFWRQFLVKYPESNQMHKRMLYARKKLYSMKNKLPEQSFNEALDKILAAQCNDPYWHGQFGGVYYLFMRSAVYSYLIQAHKIIDEHVTENYQTIEETDMDYDGKEELIIENKELLTIISPHLGGSIIEIDHKKTATNILNVLTRKEESYHTPGEAPIDLWRKTAFREFLLKKEEIEKYLINPVKTSNIIDPLETMEVQEKTREKIRLQGQTKKNKKTLTKTIKVQNNKIIVEYEYNDFNENWNTEIPLVLDDDPRNIKITTDENNALELLDSPKQIETRKIKITSKNPFQPLIELEFSEKITLTFKDLSPLVLSEADYEPSYQGILLIITKNAPTQKLEIKMELKTRTS